MDKYVDVQWKSYFILCKGTPKSVNDAPCMLYFAVNVRYTRRNTRRCTDGRTDGRRGDFNRRSAVMRTRLGRKSVVISYMPIGGKWAVMTQLLRHRGWACFPLFGIPCVCLASRSSVWLVNQRGVC